MIRSILQSLGKSAGTEIPVGPVAGTVYQPGFFEAKDLETAKDIAVSPVPGMSVDERWIHETDFVVDMIGSRLGINENNRILDFGCGPGRLSRALIRRFGCSVIAVDMAERMRKISVEYVDSPCFQVFSLEEFDAKIKDGLSVDFGLASWVLQHCMLPAAEIARIANALIPDAPFLLINGNERLVPVEHDASSITWVGDNQDVDTLMRARFTELERLSFPEELAPGITAAELNAVGSISWWRRTG
ncbi:MAG: tetratricopeptide repeat protein [Betaproteobacteria bacterium]|nr:tetratricopeptide repeat protein [Betaproteobacteria bacterium]